MAWTTPKTWSVAEKVTAALMNLHLRDNLSYLKGLLDGTGSGDVTFPTGGGVFLGDATFWMKKISNVVYLNCDSNDYLSFDRTANQFAFGIGAAAKLTVDSNGKQGGASFYDSGEFSLANSGTTNLSHGLPARPRFVWGVYGPTTGTLGDTSTTLLIPVAIGQVSGTVVRVANISNTLIAVNNISGATQFVRIFAML